MKNSTDEPRLLTDALHEAEFIAKLAHELRNPLAALRMGLQLTQRAQASGKSVDRGLAMIEGQLDQLNDLVEDLMDLARLTQGRAELRIVEMELRPALEDAADAVRTPCQRKGQQLEVALPDEPVLVAADPARITQIARKLLDNACKFSSEGGRVRLSAVREGGDAVVRVRDDGIGIAPDQLEHIFEPFHQGGAGPVKAGLGTGLALVKRLTALHGGEVTAHSPGVGKGSEFVLRLPLARR